MPTSPPGTPIGDQRASSSTPKLTALAGSSHSTSALPPRQPTAPNYIRERAFKDESHLMGGSPHRSASGSRPASSHSGSSQGRSLNRIQNSGHARRQSAFANFSTLSETSLPWTTKDIGFNAISGVLNDPSNRSAPVPKARKAEIPPVSHASIPKVKSADFDPYIKYISTAYQRYQQNKLQEIEDSKNIPSTDTPFGSLPPLLDSDQDKSADSIPGMSRNPYGIPSLTSLENLDDLELSPNLASQEYEMPMLENVPSIFFEPKFQLENPRTFDMVCEGADIVGNSGPNPPTSTNSILQEKLSHYLDTVEVHLIQEISKRSAQFFEALSNLQALHQETMDCVNQIHSIRDKMNDTKKKQCESGLEVVCLQRRRTNISLLYNGIQLVKEIRSSQPMIQILLNQGDFFAALDLIDDAKGKLHGEEESEYEREEGQNGSDADRAVVRQNSVKLLPNWNMQAIRALINFSSQLDEMYNAVGTIMEHDFINTLLSDFTLYIDEIDIESVSREILESGLSSATSRAYKNHEVSSMQTMTKTRELESLRDRMEPATMGLIRSKQVKRSLQLYRDRLLSETKTSISKQYPLSIIDTQTKDQDQEDGAQKESSGLSKQLKSMPFDNFFKTLLSIYAVIFSVIKRAICYHQILKELFEIADSRELFHDLDLQVYSSPNGNQVASPKSPKDTLVSAVVQDLLQDSNAIIFSVADMGHVRCAKLVGVRADQNAQLNPTDFYRFFDATWAFINISEKICGRTSFGLRGAIISQTKAYINNFHMERTKQEALLIENEQWSSTEVPKDFQEIVDRIRAVAAPSVLDKTSMTEILFPTAGTGQAGSSDSSKDRGEPTKFLHIDDQSYFVVGCSLLIIKMLEDYLKCMIKLDGMTVDIMQKMIELLKLFNSRVCQVILGAGAMRSAGLKNISARHLALASQSVGIMVALIPSLKQCVKRCMTDKQFVLLSEFDRMLKDYQNHQGEIHAKLIAIMNERFDAINWDTSSAQSPNAYMETLVKETTTLHKVLNKYLPPQDLKFILNRVFASFTSQLAHEYSHCVVTTQAGKDRWCFTFDRVIKDAQYFLQRLSSLDHIDPPSSSVETAAQQLTISPAAKAKIAKAET
ncbi:hypothetical protein NQZ79_g350 [Umbelopsis isabellina]|nr:hypothetical protein NQZ79_g350 [Umbelopsis isabellina]